MANSNNYVITKAAKLAWTRRVRPATIGAFIRRALQPGDLRTVVSTGSGEYFYVDPLSDLGSAILRDGCYEAKMTDRFKEILRPGMSVLDLGANEGYFSVIASLCVGPRGRVLAVEPQSRLQDILRINASLNNCSNLQCVAAAISYEPTLELCLWPSTNTGATSAVRKYLWSSASEVACGITIDALMTGSGIDYFDFVKCDIEGYEAYVIPMISNAGRRGMIGTLAIDYHAEAIAAAGKSLTELDALLVQAGFKPKNTNSAMGGYREYYHIECRFPQQE